MATFNDSFDRPDSSTLGPGWLPYEQGWSITSGKAAPAVLTELTSEAHTMGMTQTIKIKDPKAPASAAQLSYLSSLVTQRDLPAVCQRYELLNALGGVTKGQASDWINELLAAPKKAEKTPAQAFTASAEQIAQAYGVPVGVYAEAKEMAKPQLTELPGYGYYQIGEALYYWDVTGKDGWPTLRRLTIVTNYDGSKKGKWSKVFAAYATSAKLTATWIPYAGKGYSKGEKTGTVNVPKQLVDAILGGTSAMGQDEAAQLSKQFGFCIRCGATLTDPVSIAQGLGPVCVKYWGV